MLSRSSQFCLLFATTLLVYVVMVTWTLPGIANNAGGMPAFDMRPGGYSLEVAQAFLLALGAEGRSLYTGPQRWLDIAYPAMLAAVLMFSIAYFVKPGVIRWILMIFPIVGAAADYLENIAVAGMLATVPTDVTLQTVSAASRWSVLKASCTTVAGLVVLAMLAFAMGRRLGVWRKG